MGVAQNYQKLQRVISERYKSQMVRFQVQKLKQMDRHTKGLTVSSGCSQSGEQPGELFPEAQALLGYDDKHYNYAQDTSRKAKESKQEPYFKGKKTLNCQENTTHVTHKKTAKKRDVKPHWKDMIDNAVVESQSKIHKFYLSSQNEEILKFPNYNLFEPSVVSQSKGILTCYFHIDKNQTQKENYEYFKQCYHRNHDYNQFPFDEKMQQRYERNQLIYDKFWKLFESWSESTRDQCRKKFQKLINSVKNDLTLHCLAQNMYSLHIKNWYFYKEVGHFDYYVDDIDRRRAILQGKRITWKIIRKDQCQDQKETLQITFRGYQCKWGSQGHRTMQQHLLFIVKRIMDTLDLTTLPYLEVKFIHGINNGQSKWKQFMVHFFQRLQSQPNQINFLKKNKVFKVSPIRIVKYYQGHLIVGFENFTSQ